MGREKGTTVVKPARSAPVGSSTDDTSMLLHAEGSLKWQAACKDGDISAWHLSSSTFELGRLPEQQSFQMTSLPF